MEREREALSSEQPLRLKGDLLIGFDVKVEANVAASASALCYRLTDEGLQQAWAAPAPVPMTDTYGLTIANGHVCIDGDKEAVFGSC